MKHRLPFAKFFPNVRQVKDGPKTIRVDITKTDVSSSKLKDHTGCAVAEACKRQLPIDDVIISRSVAYLIKDNKATRYIIPAHTQKEIIAFDRGGRFMPGTYTLQAPSPYQKLGIKHNHRPDRNHDGDGSRGKRLGAKRPQTKGIRISLTGAR